MDAEIRPPESPTNLKEWLWYVKRYEAGIFVRDRDAEDKWICVSLAKLSPERWAHHVAGWLEKGHVPVRVRESEELSNTES